MKRLAVLLLAKPAKGATWHWTGGLCVGVAMNTWQVAGWRAGILLLLAAIACDLYGDRMDEVGR